MGCIFFSYENIDGISVIDSIESEDINSDSKIVPVSYQALSSEFKKTFTWDRLIEIKKCLDAGFYKTALLAALTLPDICYKLEYSEKMEVGNRYEKWFDDNIYKANIGETGKYDCNFDCFNGYMCYKLRCFVLHGDTQNIEFIPNLKHSSMKEKGYKHVFFKFTEYHYSEFIDLVDDSGNKYAVFYKSIYQLVMQILSFAEVTFQKSAAKTLSYDAYELLKKKEVYNIKGILDNGTLISLDVDKIHIQN